MCRRYLAALVVLPMLVATAQAQFVVSARAGLIHHLDGKVSVEDRELTEEDGPPYGWVGEGEILRTGDDGRCELILTPGSVLRVGRNSAIRLLSDDIANARVELLSGSAIVNWNTGPQDLPIRLVHGGAAIELGKHGQYRLDAPSTNAAQLQVFEGEALLAHADDTIKVRDGQAITLGTGEIGGLDTDQTDSFDDWNLERAEFIAKVNRLARTSNQRLMDGMRSIFRHLGNGQSRSLRRPLHKSP